ncbi:MAG TPA: hypothetical protein VE956_20805 [Nodularia sp. (in: cyanobacteria)]|nr:hypothetical protein [Nodularia sp. (in: cyanobacteria)]
MKQLRNNTKKYIGLIFDFCCWRSLRFALNKSVKLKMAFSHSALRTYASKYGYATQATKIKADYY